MNSYFMRLHRWNGSYFWTVFHKMNSFCHDRLRECGFLYQSTVYYKITKLHIIIQGAKVLWANVGRQPVDHLPCGSQNLPMEMGGKAKTDVLEPVPDARYQVWQPVTKLISRGVVTTKHIPRHRQAPTRFTFFMMHIPCGGDCIQRHRISSPQAD